jgi:SNF family Na+-dependent transporter
LLPFLVSSIVVGIPYALLEVSLGQWMKEGGIGAWNLTPLFKGIGFANLIIVFFGNVYYEVILAWTLRYLYDSFSFDLPWKYCSNNWNTKCCTESLLYGTAENAKNLSKVLMIYVSYGNESSTLKTCAKLVDPITEYWE